MMQYEIEVKIPKKPIELNVDCFKKTLKYFSRFKNTVDYMNNPDINNKSKFDENKKFKIDDFYNFLKSELDDFLKYNNNISDFISKLLLFRYDQKIPTQKTEITISDFFDSIFAFKRIINKGEKFEDLITDAKNQSVAAGILQQWDVNKIQDTIQLKEKLDCFIKHYDNFFKKSNNNVLSNQELKTEYQKIVELNDNNLKQLKEISKKKLENEKTKCDILSKNLKDSEFILNIEKEVVTKIEEIKKIKEIKGYKVGDISGKIKTLLQASKNNPEIIPEVCSLLKTHNSIILQINKKENLDYLTELEAELSSVGHFFYTFETRLFDNVKGMDFSNVKDKDIKIYIQNNLKNIETQKQNFEKMRAEKLKKLQTMLNKYNQKINPPNSEVKQMLKTIKVNKLFFDNVKYEKVEQNKKDFLNDLDNAQKINKENELTTIDSKYIDSHCDIFKCYNDIEKDLRDIQSKALTLYSIYGKSESVEKLKKCLEETEKFQWFEKEKVNFSYNLNQTLFVFQYQKSSSFWSNDKLNITTYDIS